MALFLLRRTRCNTWAELATRIADEDEDVLIRLGEIHITATQERLVRQHGPVISLLRVSDPINLCACDTCGGWLLLGPKKQPPSTCRTTLGCAGTPVTAPRATKAPVDDPQASEVETGKVEVENGQEGAEVSDRAAGTTPRGHADQPGDTEDPSGEADDDQSFGDA